MHYDINKELLNPKINNDTLKLLYYLYKFIASRYDQQIKINNICKTMSSLKKLKNILNGKQQDVAEVFQIFGAALSNLQSNSHKIKETLIKHPLDDNIFNTLFKYKNNVFNKISYTNFTFKLCTKCDFISLISEPSRTYIFPLSLEPDITNIFDVSNLSQNNHQMAQQLIKIFDPEINKSNEVYLSNLLQHALQFEKRNCETKCPQCDSDICFTDKLFMDEYTNHFNIQIKRFDKGWTNKLNNPIIPDEILKICNKKFNLTSIICHLGTTISSGHYIIYVNSKNKWYKLNDNNKKQIENMKDNKEEITKNGYLFCYTKSNN